MTINGCAAPPWWISTILYRYQPYLRLIETPGTKATTSQGWALIQTPAGGALSPRVPFSDTVFRIARRWEASVPAITYNNSGDYIIPFDKTNSGYGVAIANASQHATMIAFLSFRNEQGNEFILSSLVLEPYQHTAFIRTDLFSEAADRRGTLRIFTASIGLNVFVYASLRIH